MTKKKLIVGGFSLIATLLLATASFAVPCSSGINVHYVGIGSSAEFQTLGFGANDAIQHVAGYTAPTNIWSNAAAQVIDARTAVNTIDTGLKIWVFYDSSATCNVYVGYQADSVQGNKDFFCYGKVATGFVGTEANCYGHSTGAGSWEQANSGGNVIFGLSDVPAATPLPIPIQTFLVTAPLPTKTGTKQNLPPAYCGQKGTPGAKTAYCYFNVAHTDIRPEDGLYATTRALSSYNTTNGMAGLGYNQTACGSTGTGTKTVGCPIYDSFGKKAVFYPNSFSLKTDPYTAAAVPGYTTLSIGASPELVFVSNVDGSGFGQTQSTDGSYLYKNINRKVLAHVFDGTDSCTGDLLASYPTPAGYAGTVGGAGQPIQVVIREPLSGTYNTFEFSAVRDLTGGAATAIKQSTITDLTWISDVESSQEIDLRGNLGTTAGADGPAFNFNTGTGCPGNANAAPDGTAQCGDPLFVQTSSCGSGTTKGLHLRAIGTGEEVAATLGQDNTGGSQVVDGIGYAFWGYSNFKPGASGCSGGGTSGDVTCSTYAGHYLTVDGIDPLFQTAGGALDASPNPNGGYNFPQCGLVQKVAGYGFPCEQIPFTHVYDGTYPIWSLLRLVTFDNVGSTQQTPEGVINVLSYAQLEAAPGSAEQLSDFVPFLNTITGLPYTQGGTLPSGDLNLGVFRSHYVQSTVDGDNGHVACAGVFTGVSITGGTSGSKTCLVDLGGDMGGSVLTVQSDVDFSADFGGAVLNGRTAPKEIYGLHQ
jgi:hypothetical protein